jgi:4-hydroxy 2-oxovalerate aldolase
MGRDLEILDTTLRDGSYVIDFQFTAEDTALIASALESAGIRLIEIAHGLGLGAARAGKGDQAATDEEYLSAAAGVLKEARFGAFFIPGIGDEDDLRLAADCGAGFIRIGTNITEFDRAEPYISIAKRLGLTVSCNLMKSYAVPPEDFARRAAQAENAGADILCLVDSAGGMLPEDVRAYLEAARAASAIALGFHGHDNLCMAVANSLEAWRAGAAVVDASLQGLGRSEGNAVTEVLVAILQKHDALTDVDVHALLDVSEAFVRPLIQERGRSSLGITAGRAKFHSSFLGRVLTAATRHGVDPRDLILRLCERDRVNAPAELIETLAADLAAEGPRAPVRVDMAAVAAAVPEAFDDQVLERARELREKARKLGLKSIFNIVVSPYELTHVSPFVETNYGCAMSNVMLAEPNRLEAVLKAVDGIVDYVLLDPGGRPVPEGMLRQTGLLTYLDHAMWARATVAQLTLLLGGSLYGKKIAVTGIPPLAARAAMGLGEAGADVILDPLLEREARALLRLGPSIIVKPLDQVVEVVDAVVSLSPRQPAVGADLAERMRPGALLYDGGIGSLDREAVPAAEARGIQVVRVDMRPSLAATALELLGMRHIILEHMGRDEWGGVGVVAGGLIGREGDVIVDSIKHPTRVIGVADGRGGILRPAADDEAVLKVRQAIAEKRLAGG